LTDCPTTSGRQDLAAVEDYAAGAPGDGYRAAKALRRAGFSAARQAFRNPRHNDGICFKLSASLNHACEPWSDT
jgi:hypothetical protein